MDSVQIFNAVEAGWWGLVALAVCFMRLPARIRRERWLLVVLLLLFGVSDLVEIQTGAWWRPWWLGVWKAACVAGIGAIATLVWRRWRTHQSDTPQ